MNSAVGLWVAAEWRRRWPALLGIAMLVALAGAAATALAAGARRADSAYGRFLEATGAPNLTAQVVLGGTKPTSADVAADRFGAHVEATDELAAVDGVESVAVESWWAIAIYPEFDAPGVVTAFATGTFATAGAPATPIVIAGELPGVDEADAVVINETAADELDLGIGSALRFRTASPARMLEWVNNDGQFDSEAALDGPTIDVHVAAVTRTDGDLEAAFPAVVFSEGFARAHGDEIAHAETYINLRVDPDRLDAIAADVRAIIEPYGLEVVPSTSVGAAIIPSIDVGVTTLWIAAAVATLGGLLLIAQALGRFVAATSTDEPALSAMGMTRAQRTTGPVALALVGTAAGALAVPLVAWAASGLFPRGAAALAEPGPGLRWDVQALATGALITFAASSVMVVLLAAAGSRPRAARASSTGRLSHLLSGRPALSLGTSFAADPAGAGRRSRVLGCAAVVSIAIAVAAVLVVATLNSSRRHLESSPRLYGAAADLVYESNGWFGLANVIETTVATPGVTAVTSQLAINDDSLTATGPGGIAEVEPEAYDTHVGGAVVPIADGAYPQGPDQVAIGSETAAALGATVGDTVTLEPDDGPPLTLTVTGVAVSWDSTDPEHAFVVQPAALQTLLCPGTSLDDCNLSVNVFASVGSEAAVATLAALGFDTVPPPANVTRIGQVGPIPWLLAAFLCVFAAAGLLHAVLTSLRRRRRDLAIARALGLGPRRAAAALTWQAVLTAVAGTLAGLLLGAIAGPATWRAIADGLGVIVAPRFPPLLAAGVAALGVLAAAAISAWPRWRAVHLSPADALRSE